MDNSVIPGRGPGNRQLAWAVALAALLASLTIRASHITSTALWLDEAESSINALTVLERGYPADRYLGIPIFENMMIRPWPDHPEYEFKDVSYSDRGMAVYHSWLPLYAIAASFKLFGVQPAAVTPGWQISVGAEELERRTLAARLPSLLFTAAFLALMFCIAYMLDGYDAALAVLLLTGLSASVIEMTLYARYYALMLAVSAAGALTLWRLVQRGERKDFVAHTIVLILLFYSHLIAFANLVALTTLMMLFARGWQPFRRWVVCMIAIGACGLPWVIATGYVQHLRYMSSGLALVRFPEDLFTYLSRRTPYFALFSVGAVWLTLAGLLHGKTLPGRLREPWRRSRREYLFLLAWMVIATATYFLCSPAASLFPQRLSLVLFVPGFLFMAMTLADAARTISRSRASILTPSLALGFLLMTGLLRSPTHDPFAFQRFDDEFRFINQLNLKPDAKVYASPSSNLVLMFYSDKPIQSIAPVRKAYLDGYPGEILYLERQFNWEFTAPSDEEIEEAADELSVRLSPGEIDRLRDSLSSRFAQERTEPRVEEMVPSLMPLSPLEEAIMRRTRLRGEEGGNEEEGIWNARSLPFARGYRIRSASDLWQIFFYRLVGPDARSGAGFNGAERLWKGCAYFIPSSNLVAFYSESPLVPRVSETTSASRTAETPAPLVP